MNSIKQIIDLGICTGCYACDGICPNITFRQGNNAFLEPVVGDRCTGCGLCLKFCPLAQGGEAGNSIYV